MRRVTHRREKATMSSIYRSEAGARVLREHYLRALQRWPVDNDRIHVPTPEGETFVIASGPESAPPLVLLHGSGANATQWLDRISELATHFRVYAVDLIGEPGLSAPSRPPLTSERHTVWLDAVLDFLGLERVRIMGVSLGGWLAVDYATRRPGRVDRLALSCPVGIGKPKTGYLFKSILLAPFGRWGRRRMVTGMLGPGMSTMPPEEVETVVDTVQLVSRNFRYRSGRVPVFTDEVLRRLTMPVHVLVGQLDVLLDAAGLERRFHAAAPRVTVRVLPGIGHFIPAQIGAELEFLTDAGQDEHCA
jgi:pimeloyl-ACP methyl ester carboxylesterase